KNEQILNEVQERNKIIEKYNHSNQSLKKEINNFETKSKNSEIMIQNLKDENKKINEENFKLKEQIEMLNDISIEKEKLANENEHLRLIAQELDINNEEIDDMKNDYSGKPTLMDEIQSEVSSSDQDRNQIENVLKSKLRTCKFKNNNKFNNFKSQFENRDLKEKIKLLEEKLEELNQIRKKENDKFKTTSDENINDIINKVKEDTKLEIIKTYNNKEKQDLIQEIERQKLVINKLNDKEKIAKEYDKNTSKISLVVLPTSCNASINIKKFNTIIDKL
ncbi:hypothetical protein PIROE2DRAFT_12277, partial [Piromyces sp. E2]